LTGKSSRTGLRKCYACRETFTVRMGTIFEDSKLALHLWLQVIHLMCASKKGIATRQIQRMLNCSMKTAWHLSHRIRAAMADGGLGPLGGEGAVIEADTTYVGGKEKNKHKWQRDPKNIGGAGKQIVHTLVERGGRARSHHIPNVNGNTLRPILEAHANPASSFMTDTAGGYMKIGKRFARHEMVDHGAGEYVRGDAHSNTAEGYFAIFKRGITGVYHSVSEAHLHRYLAEFDFRYSNREKLGVDDVSRADMALRGFKGKRLTYQKVSGARRAETATA
jgi:transposase-like protein